MASMGNFWSVADIENMSKAWLSGQEFTHRQVIFRKFIAYERRGNQTNPNETFRAAKYAERAEHVWISEVKVYDTVKKGYFTTGDMDCASTFRIQGVTPQYTLANGVVVPEYGGDEIIWLGKIWVVTDQVEPVEFTFKAPQVWWRTVMRKTERSGIGNAPGP